MKIKEMAEKYASEQCEIIQKRREMGLDPYYIKDAIIRDYTAAAEAILKECEAAAISVQNQDGDDFDVVTIDHLRSLFEEQK